MTKLYAQCDFINSNVGTLKRGDDIERSNKTKDLETTGYLSENNPNKEYKTKVVHQEPEKPVIKNKRKRTKK